MKILPDLKYTKEHEWVKVEGKKAYFGITDHAQEALGDIVFIELPAVGAKLTAGKPFSVVESTKAASDIYAPLSGTVIEVNNVLADATEQINKKPYESWFVVVELSESAQQEIGRLLSASDYEKFCAQEG